MNNWALFSKQYSVQAAVNTSIKGRYGAVAEAHQSIEIFNHRDSFTVSVHSWIKCKTHVQDKFVLMFHEIIEVLLDVLCFSGCRSFISHGVLKEFLKFLIKEFIIKDTTHAAVSHFNETVVMHVETTEDFFGDWWLLEVLFVVT